MKARILCVLVISFLISTKPLAQISVYRGGFFAKEFSKDLALYKAKEFVAFGVLGATNDLTKAEIFPLAATKSGELTSLVYLCDAKKKEGLVLGFYGSRWNESGVTYTGFEFKDVPKEKALILLKDLQKKINDNDKYLNKDRDNHNIFYKYEDLSFLIYAEGLSYKIRVFYNEFDSEWDYEAFRKTKKRFEGKVD